MHTIKLKYTKRTLKTHLFLGLGFLLLGLFGVFFDAKSNYNFVIAVLYLGGAYYYSNYPMIVINGLEIKQNWWFGKKIALQDILEIKYFAGDYIIKNQNMELGICKSELSVEDQQLITDFLRRFEDKWSTAMPFALSQKE